MSSNAKFLVEIIESSNLDSQDGLSGSTNSLDYVLRFNSEYYIINLMLKVYIYTKK